MGFLICKGMNEIVYSKNNQAITNSLIVAEKFNKDHRHVLDAIRDLQRGCAENSADPMFQETTYVNEQNKQSYPMFIMNRDGFTLLAMGFTGDKALSFKIEYIKAFNKMEAYIKGNQNLPKTFAEALRLAADQQEKIEMQKKQLEEQAPKVDFFDSVAESKHAIEMKAVANTLNFVKVGRNKLFQILRDNKILQQNNLPYQRYVDCHYFRTIEQQYTKDGEVKISIKTLVYQKGVNYIKELLKKLGYKQVENVGLVLYP